MSAIKNKLKKITKSNRLLYSISIRLLRLGNRFKKSISGKNNKIINKGVVINVKYDIVGNNNTIQISKNSILSDTTIFMRGDNHSLILGEDSRYSGGELWFEDDFCEINIGKNTTVESAHIAVTEPNRKISIGEDCMLSSAIEFRTGDSHSIIDNSNKVKINHAKDITVGNHVWIGAHSKILKGVTIGNNSIIGTSSIVTKNIPAHTIAAGIPAKIVKENIDWARERYLKP